MRVARTALILVGFALPTRVVAAQVTQPPRLYRNPTMNADKIAFMLGDALWNVSRKGGTASKMATPGPLRAGPIFSPDGRSLAISSGAQTTDVYVIDMSSGASRRVTWHPGAESVLGWTPDGKDILFTMPGVTARPGGSRLYRVAASGDETPDLLPIPQGSDAAYGPDGNQLAYSPIVRPVGNRIPWKQYRAGGMSHLSIANLTTLDVRNISGERSNDVNPMWVGSRVYYLSDRDGPVTLYVYDIATGGTQRLIENHGFDLKSASTGPGGIVYEQVGGIYIYDFATRQSLQVSIEIPESALPDRRPRDITIPPAQASDVTLSPRGDRFALSARGEVFVVAADTSVPARNLTNTITVREYGPAWAPNGAQVAYFQDSLGTVQLVFSNSDGSGTPRRVRLAAVPANSAGGYDAAHWSPDGTRLAYTDGQALWVIPAEGGAPVRVGAGSMTDAPWSPDSKWLTFTSANRVRLYGVDSRTLIAATDGTIQVSNATFDPTGQFVYFLGSLNRNSSSIVSGMSYNLATTMGVYAVALKRGATMPTAPGGTVAPTHPDSAGLTNRVATLPIQMANYSNLIVDSNGNIYVGEGPSSIRSTPFTSIEGGTFRNVRQFKWGGSTRDLFTSPISSPQLSSDGTTLLYQQGGTWRTVTLSQLTERAPFDPSAGHRFVVRGLTARTDPAAEWAFIYHDAWRAQLESFYDITYHGLDMAKAERVHEAFLPGLTTRSDLGYLMREMFTNLSVGHISVGDPPAPIEAGATPPPVGGRGGRGGGGAGGGAGVLGVDVVRDSGRYRISRIYRGDPWVGPRGPLGAPGVEVNEGEYLLAVNDKQLRASDNFFRAFDGTAGRRTTITVGDATGGNARQITVTPTGSEEAFRQFQWIEDNIRKVDSLSRGRIAYIFMPNTGTQGWDSFLRYYLLQNNKAGIIVDERNNAGGDIAEFPLMLLARNSLTGPAFGRGRPGGNDTLLMARGRGARAMIINESAASGGDIMPYIFQHEKLGTLVGTRTYGIAIGGAAVATMLDGSQIRVPRGAVTGFGEWAMEGVGVAPDIEVRITPQDFAAGRDPQLEAAVKHVLYDLETRPVVQYRRPPYIRPYRGNGLDREPPPASTGRPPR